MKGYLTTGIVKVSLIRIMAFHVQGLPANRHPLRMANKT